MSEPRPEIRRIGLGVSSGIAFGRAYLIGRDTLKAPRHHMELEDLDTEIARLYKAIALSDKQLAKIKEKLASENESDYHIITAHQMMLHDEHMVGAAVEYIKEDKINAEWALRRAVDDIRGVFDSIEDPYLRERKSDVEFVFERVLRNLLGRATGPLAPPPDAVVVAYDLSPADTAQLHKAAVSGLITDAGGKTSHTAIISRALDLPYVAGVKGLSGRIRPGTMLIVDGARGDVVVDPSDQLQDLYRARAAAQRRRDEQLLAEKDLPAVTTDGVAIGLSTNVESLLGVAAVAAAGADGIGLFRTEFLYLERPDLPTEEEQYRDAVSVLNAVGGRSVTFRTLDLGGDKLPLAISMPRGPNPALGVRSLRFSLDQPEIFRTQLRALYRASASGPMRIMLPLVTSTVELQRALAICAGVRDALTAEGIAYDKTLPIGIMIETPSAAITADLLAQHAQFFSLGTNDLIQYSCAADRDNADVAHLQDPLQPAILRLLKQVIDAAVQARIPLSICGDMAGNPCLTWLLLGLGLRELSMEAHAIPAVKAIIRRSSMAEAQALAVKALASPDEKATAHVIRAAMGPRFAADFEALQPDAGG